MRKSRTFLIRVHKKLWKHLYKPLPINQNNKVYKPGRVFVAIAEHFHNVRYEMRGASECDQIEEDFTTILVLDQGIDFLH